MFQSCYAKSRFSCTNIRIWNDFTNKMQPYYNMYSSPAKLRKKIEWVSLMLGLSSKTRVFPSPKTPCSIKATDKTKRVLLENEPDNVGNIAALRFLQIIVATVAASFTDKQLVAIFLFWTTSALPRRELWPRAAANSVLPHGTSWILL